MFHFCMLSLRIRRKELKVKSYLCRLPSAVNVMLNLSNKEVNKIYSCCVLITNLCLKEKLLSAAMLLLQCHE